MTGLEVMRSLMAAGKRPPIAEIMGFDLKEIDDGRAVVTATPGGHVYNLIGSVHGGYAATLLDSACGCAVHSKLPEGRTFTTLELKVSYHRALTKDTGEVRAEGIVLSIGKRVAFAEAKLLDGAGRLCASATSTLLVIER